MMFANKGNFLTHHPLRVFYRVWHFGGFVPLPGQFCWGGKEPLTLGTGETRTFIEDGDTLTLTGVAKGDGYQIGFGDCVGTIKPAVKFPS